MSLDVLPDEVLKVIVHWVAAGGIADLARFRASCRRVQRLVDELIYNNNNNNNDLLSQFLLDTRQLQLPKDVTCTTLEDYALLELLLLSNSSSTSSTSTTTTTSSSFWKENRIGFGHGKTKIDVKGKMSGVKHSMHRLHLVQSILQTFPKAIVCIDAHSGNAGPRGPMADQMSETRGLIVAEHLKLKSSNNNNNNNNNNKEDDDMKLKMLVRFWGHRIADIAAAAAEQQYDHNHCALAREGKGWVELYIQWGNNQEYPPRPSYYDYQGQGQVIDPRNIYKFTIDGTDISDLDEDSDSDSDSAHDDEESG